MYENIEDLLSQNKLTWDLFTRHEEYNNSNLDNHDRFLYEFEKDRDLINPIVSEYLVENGKRCKWPGNSNFAVCLTHDIDHIYPSMKYRFYTGLKYGINGAFKKSFDRILVNDNPYWNFNEIIELEKKYNAKSTFYFLATDKDVNRNVYEIEKLRDVFEQIKSAEFEIGLHGGYYSYNNFDKIFKEKNKLEKIAEIDIKSYRNHYLRFKTPETWKYLKKEGITKGVFNTGDVMYDALLNNIKIAEEKSDILSKLNLNPKNYFLSTVHRPSNTDNKNSLSNILKAFSDLDKKVVFPIHPRTKKFIEKHNLEEEIGENILIIKPIGYLDFLKLEKNAEKILTDSGGIQKEAYLLKVPCITLRENTEWVETVEDGWNILVGAKKQKILDAIYDFFPEKKQEKYFGKGDASKKIKQILSSYLNQIKSTVE